MGKGHVRVCGVEIIATVHSTPAGKHGRTDPISTLEVINKFIKFLIFFCLYIKGTLQWPLVNL